MAINGINVTGTNGQPNQPPKKGGLNELAQALGVDPNTLKTMSKEEVEKLAKQRGGDLD